MTAARRIDVRIGLTKVSAPQFASEPDFVSSVQKQVKTLRDDLDYIFQQFDDVSAEICLEALRPTFEKSQVYCPHQTGTLRDSGYLEIVSFRGNERVEIGYAKGGNPRYAVVVHENLEQIHQPPTQAKFLERAINEDIGTIIDRVSDGYAKFMGV